jgi:O-antigen ligase
VFLLGSAVFLLLFLLFAESFPAFLGKGLLLGRTESNVSTLTNRTPIWSELFDYAIDRPFTGYGYNSFWNPDHIGNMTFIKGWGIATAHSAYLDVQLSLGIIGLAVYVLVFITGIYYGIKGFKLYGNKEYLLCSLVLLYYSAYNLMESELLAASSFMTFMFFLCTSKIGYYVNRNRRTK